MLARSSGNLCLVLGGTWIAIDRVGRTICVGDDQEWRMPDSDPVVCQALIEGGDRASDRGSRLRVGRPWVMDRDRNTQMKALRIASAFLVAGPPVWLISASALYCQFSGHWNLFAFPYTQWVQAAPWWRLNWRMMLWVIGSAAAPTLLLLVGVAVALRLSVKRNKRPELYGNTGWADANEMRSGGIGRRKAIW
jgi:hypothetical protein